MVGKWVNSPLLAGLVIAIMIFQVTIGTFTSAEASPFIPAGTIIVKKTIPDPNLDQSFFFTSDIPTAETFEITTVGGSGSKSIQTVQVPGTFSISEVVPSGWNLLGATCDDGSPVDQIELGPNETVTCTFANIQEGCLIATATFGSEMAPQVQMLREFRDNTVYSTKVGKNFMVQFNQLYYSFSPMIAEMERENSFFKETVKVYITPLMATLSLSNNVEIDSEEDLVLFGLGIILMNVGLYFVGPAILIIKIRGRLRRKHN